MTAAASQTAIEFARLEIGYGTERVAGPLDGRLAAGRVHLLTGPNGGGKTTLMRTLLGLLPALDGRIDGTLGHTVSYVPQLGAIDLGFPVTCLEVVGTGLPLGIRRAERRSRAAESLEAMGLGDRARHSFARLSGGQRQRVFVARALCADARIIALDEPTAGVDAASSSAIWQAARGLADRGKLVIAVTHDLFRAPEFADRLLVLDDGQLDEREPSSVTPTSTAR